MGLYVRLILGGQEQVELKGDVKTQQLWHSVCRQPLITGGDNYIDADYNVIN